MPPKVKYKQLHILKDSISYHNDKLWLPYGFIPYVSDPTNSWFDKNYFSKDNHFDFIKTNASIPKSKGQLYKSKTVLLKINHPYQKIILLNWLNAFRIMYNYTINHIFNNLRRKDIILLKKLSDENCRLYNLIKTKSKENNNLKTKNMKLNKSINKLLIRKKNNKDNVKRINKLKQVILEITNNKELIKQNNIVINENNKILKLTENNKKVIYKKIYDSLSYYTIRSYILKETRDLVINNSTKSIRNELKDLINDNKEITIYAHILDTAIKKACANYKTCVTNYLEGNCKSFIIKYWRRNKKTLMMEIEKDYVKNGQIAESKLGKMRYYYDKEEFDLPNTTINLYYNRETDQFTVGVPEKIKKEISKNIKTVGIDQGVKSYLTCITDDEAIKYGTNLIDKLMPKIDKILRAKSISCLSTERKRGIEKKYMTKIRNLVDDAQWKIINDLTNNYKSIIIGNLSTRDITNKERSVMTSNMKELSYKLRFYEFRQRLKYKCEAKGVNYKIINEAYTSKVCTNCGSYKKELKNDRIYNCRKCKTILDRDLNGARNILIKTMI